MDLWFSFLSLSEMAALYGLPSFYPVTSASLNLTTLLPQPPGDIHNHAWPQLVRKVGTATVPLKGLLVRIKVIQGPTGEALLLAGPSHRSPSQPWEA